MTLDALPTPLAPAAGAVLRTASADVDEHCENLGEWRLNYDQLSAGAFRGSFTQLSLPRMNVFREVTSQQVRQQGELGINSFGIALPWTPGGEVNCNGRGVSDAQVIAAFDTQVDMCTPRGFELRGLVTRPALIAEVTAALDIELPPWIWHQFGAIDIDEASLARLRQLLTLVEEAIAVQPGVFDNPALCRSVEDSLLIEVTDMLPTAHLRERIRSAEARKRTVARACDIMQAHHAEPLSILDVCKAVGASRRKLNYCFQEVLGTNPVNYLRAVRLNRVRRDLKLGHDQIRSIYDVAATHGFWHFSQFSLDYKRHFGELPSATLRRGRPAGPDA